MNYLLGVWKNNPVRCASVLASIVVFAAAKLGVVLDEQSVGEALVAVVPILLGGELARGQVTPFTGEPGVPSDDLLEMESLSP